MDDFIENLRQKMQKVLEVLRTDLGTVRTGRAAPSLVENIVINAYGGTQKLRVLELATISVSDSHSLVLTPFDPSIIGEIQKGILETNVGLTPVIDGNLIRISIPPLSEERRAELVKLMHQKLENGRIMIRQVRHEAMNELKKQYNDKTISEDQLVHQEKEIQKTTDQIMGEIKNLGEHKEKELIEV